MTNAHYSSEPNQKRTAVYVDGYNLYYGRLRHTAFKWLDLVALFRSLLKVQDPSSKLLAVKIYTAPALEKFATHGKASVHAQQSYHRALQRLYPDEVFIKYGNHSYDKNGSLLPSYIEGRAYNNSERTRVWKIEEKKTDVNLAMAMYRDAVKGLYDHMVICSNDSDAEPVLEALREDFPKKLFIRTFGCQMNEYDSDKMADVLAAQRRNRQDRQPEEADIILFNTCSVREKAQERVFHDLGRVRLLKQANPEPDHRCRRLRGQPGRRGHRRPRALRRRRVRPADPAPPAAADRRAPCGASRRSTFPSPKSRSSTICRRPRSRARLAFVSIMEGCSKFCTFCIVPYTRGEEVSRPFDDVLTEVAGLAAQGVKEVTLLGQNVNAYRGAMADSDEIADLALLIEYIAEMPGIERIRYTTSHPREMTQRLIDVLREACRSWSRICTCRCSRVPTACWRR
jgi:uncharacterized LabA/DUF88 family protein